MTRPAEPADASTLDGGSIVIVGHVCIDENTGVDAEDERVAGSPAFFMNRHLQSLPGVSVSVIAPYGADFRSVDTTLPLLNAPTAARTLLYRNHIDGDERRQECFHSEGAAPVPLTPAFERELGVAGLVVVCPLLPNFTPEYLNEVLAPVAAVKVLLVQGYLRTVAHDGTVSKRSFDEYAEVVPRFDVAILSDEDMDDALETAATWSLEFPSTQIVVTQNRLGASFFERGVGVNVPARALERPGVGSVIGAGDVFSAALAVSCTRGVGIGVAVEQANTVAAGFIDSMRVAALSGR